ncbi:MAG: SDR family oxidoreductase [Bacteroidales bacterium]|nr:SDR family oxidoreductase [Bacteroidales bacterium]
MKINNKNIWITGASSGIGRGLSVEMSKYNTTIVLSARNVIELEKVKFECEQNGAKCIIQKIDLSNPEEIISATENVFSKIKNVDILVNNGGISQRAFSYETDISVDRRIMEVNYFGSITLTKLVLPKMIEQKSGYILAVSSIVGAFGFPLRSAYSASKHALHGFYETLYFEVKKYNINVSVVLPGRVKTDVSKNALTKNGTKYGKMDDGQDSGISVEKCAKKIIKGINKNKKEMAVGGSELAMLFVKRRLPFIFNMIVNKIKPT